MINTGSISEIDEIITLTKSCGKHMRDNGIDQWDENYPDRLSIEKDLKTKTLFVYKEDKIIIGIVVLNEHQDEEYQQVKWSTSEKHKNLVVHRLAVLPNHQGKGLARKLMDFAETFAKEKKLRRNSSGYL